MKKSTWVEKHNLGCNNLIAQSMAITQPGLKYTTWVDFSIRNDLNEALIRVDINNQPCFFLNPKNSNAERKTTVMGITITAVSGSAVTDLFSGAFATAIRGRGSSI